MKPTRPATLADGSGGAPRRPAPAAALPPPIRRPHRCQGRGPRSLANEPQKPPGRRFQPRTGQHRTQQPPHRRRGGAGQPGRAAPLAAPVARRNRRPARPGHRRVGGAAARLARELKMIN